MSNLDFKRADYPKHQSVSIIIKHAVIKLNHEDKAGAVQKGRYDTDSFPITLSKEHLEKMNEIENEENEYLVQDEDLDEVTIVYGNTI